MIPNRFSLLGIFLGLVWSAPSPAIVGCAARDAILRAHGVSYSGFKTTLPPVAEPDKSRWDKGDVLRVSLDSGTVQDELASDRFFHTAVINKSLGQAWIHRTGGIGGVSEWYGPVVLSVASYDNCDMKTATADHRALLTPSSELLKRAGVSQYQRSDDIRIKVGSDGPSSLDALPYCENAVAVPLKVLSNMKNITKVIAAVETAAQTKPKRLFTLNDDGGLSRWGVLLTVSLNLQDYNPGVANVWVFVVVQDRVYANVAQVRCNVVS